MFTFNTLLVPVDFSPPSLAAAEHAVSLAGGEEPMVILLHVLDVGLIEFAVSHELGEREGLLRGMRARAEQQAEALRTRLAGRVNVQAIVCEGVPFVEIIKKAEEFLVDAIVMGRVGVRGSLEKLLFGTTAERVLRGTSRPVLVLPHRG
jgi:nucleotide-binding universal stress UspA family protein